MIFLDTNVLVAFLSGTHDFHSRAYNFMNDISKKNEQLVISPQVVGECFVYMTSKKAHTKPLKPEGFEDIFGKLLENYTIRYVSPTEEAIRMALKAAIKRRIASAGIFDLIIYGTMREHGITQIATFNIKHFRNLEGIELVDIP